MVMLLRMERAPIITIYVVGREEGVRLLVPWRIKTISGVLVVMLFHMSTVAGRSMVRVPSKVILVELSIASVPSVTLSRPPH